MVEDLEADELVFTFRLQGFLVWSVEALDSDRVALGCSDGFLRVVSRTRNCIVNKVEHKSPKILAGASKRVNSLACDPFVEAGDSWHDYPSLLVSGSETGLVHVRDKNTLKHDAQTLCLEFTTTSVSVSSKYVAAASYNNKVRLFSRRGPNRYYLVHTISVHMKPVTCVFLCPATSFVLSAGLDGLCYLTDVESGEQRWKADLRVFKNSPVLDPTDILLLKDGRVALTVLEELHNQVEPDNESIEVRIWDAPTCLSPRPATKTYPSISGAKSFAHSPRPSAHPVAVVKKAPKRNRVGDFVQEAVGIRVAQLNSKSDVVNGANRSSSAGEVVDLAGTEAGSTDPPPLKNVRTSTNSAAAGKSSQHRAATEKTARPEILGKRNDRGAHFLLGEKETTNAPVPLEPTHSQIPLEPDSSEALLKAWSESGLQRQDVRKMRRKQLASALSAYLLDLDFDRLEEFKVLERILQDSFILSIFRFPR